MDQDRVIRSLRLQLLVERAAFAIIAIVLLAAWAHGRINNTKSFILVNGKPVACLRSEQDAQDVLRSVKSKTGCKLSEIEFKEDVVIARAPRDAQPVSRHMAFRTVSRSLSPVVPRWAVLVNGRPAIAVPSRTIAGEALDLAKLRFGKLVKNLAEEPQFKEEVTVDIAPVSPSIYAKSAEEAVSRLFDQQAPVSDDGVYTVERGDVASTIAARCHVKLGELATMNPGRNLDRLQIGDKLRIKAAEQVGPKLTVVVRDQSDRTERIPPPLQRVSSTSLYAGKTAEVSPGKPGLRRVKVATIYENGRQTGSEIISEEILHEPSPRIVATGIKPR